jgi:hypothetical protein
MFFERQETAQRGAWGSWRHVDMHLCIQSIVVIQSAKSSNPPSHQARTHAHAKEKEDHHQQRSDRAHKAPYSPAPPLLFPTHPFLSVTCPPQLPHTPSAPRRIAPAVRLPDAAALPTSDSDGSWRAHLDLDWIGLNWGEGRGRAMDERNDGGVLCCADAGLRG